MRTVNRIVVHCTATVSFATSDSLLKFWREKKGWQSPGYHYLIHVDGRVEQLLCESKISNGASGYNLDSIHIAYIGGRFVDDRSVHQVLRLREVIAELLDRYPGAEVCGHRDLPGVKKECPRFDVKKEFEEILE